MEVVECVEVVWVCGGGGVSVCVVEEGRERRMGCEVVEKEREESRSLMLLSLQASTQHKTGKEAHTTHKTHAAHTLLFNATPTPYLPGLLVSLVALGLQQRHHWHLNSQQGLGVQGVGLWILFVCV